MNTQAILIGICIILSLVIAILLMRRGKEKDAGIVTSTSAGDVADVISGTGRSMEPAAVAMPPVCFKEASPLSLEDERRLVEVTDRKLLGCIDATIPVMVQGAANAAAITNISSVIKAHNDAIETAGTLYRAHIPAGATLANSKAMEGAKRGIFHGANGIQGQANLTSFDAKIDPGAANPLVAASFVNVAMSVGSMVVGQYYMTQINGRLDGIERSLNEVSDFLKREFKARTFALLVQVKKCSQFKIETMESEESRQRELLFLKEREHECIELLGQVNFTLEDYVRRDTENFEDYEKQTMEMHGWHQYQQILLGILGEVSELTYVLSMGALSRENCNALMLPYRQQSADVAHRLRLWHGRNASKYQLDQNMRKRRRLGAGGALMSLPGILNDDLNYLPVDRATTKLIKGQMREMAVEVNASAVEPYEEDVELVMIDDQLYYLPPKDSTDIVA